MVALVTFCSVVHTCWQVLGCQHVGSFSTATAPTPLIVDSATSRMGVVRYFITIRAYSIPWSNFDAPNNRYVIIGMVQCT